MQTGSHGKALTLARSAGAVTAGAHEQPARRRCTDDCISLQLKLRFLNNYYTYETKFPLIILNYIYKQMLMEDH